MSQRVGGRRKVVYQKVVHPVVKAESVALDLYAEIRRCEIASLLSFLRSRLLKFTLKLQARPLSNPIRHAGGGSGELDFF
jgi:hypothetical protein